MTRAVTDFMLVYLQTIETDEEHAKFEAIYREYRGLMYYVAYRRLGHEQDAEDVVHYAFLKIAEHIKKIELPCPKTKQLVVTIVDNRVTDLLRARGRHPTVELDERWQGGQVPDTEDLLTQCILRLPEQQRMVIWLKYVQGYTLREIAGLMGISLASAQKIDQRGKKKLEQLYREGGGEL